MPAHSYYPPPRFHKLMDRAIILLGWTLALNPFVLLLLNQRQVPVMRLSDLQPSAKKLGVYIQSAPPAEKVSGVLVQDPSYGSPSSFVIFVNESEPAPRPCFRKLIDAAMLLLGRGIMVAPIVLLVAKRW